MRSDLSGRYGLQLAAFSERAKADAYVERHRLRAATAIYRVRRDDGTVLFAVIAGDYASRAQAAAAATLLPLSVRASEPWPRPLAGLVPATP